MTLKKRYYALIKVLVDNQVRIEWMRSTRDENWKLCFGDGDRGDPGDRQAGEGGPLYPEEPKDETQNRYSGEGTRGVKEVAPELASRVGVSHCRAGLGFRGPGHEEVVETVCGKQKEGKWPSLRPAEHRRWDSQEANRVTLRCEAVGVADVVLAIIVATPPAH